MYNKNRIKFKKKTNKQMLLKNGHKKHKLDLPHNIPNHSNHANSTKFIPFDPILARTTTTSFTIILIYDKHHLIPNQKYYNIRVSHYESATEPTNDPRHIQPLSDLNTNECDNAHRNIVATRSTSLKEIIFV